METIQNISQTNSLDITLKSIDAVNKINQMIVDNSQNLQNKLLNFNVEQKLEDLKQEGIARNIDVLA